MAKRRLTEDDPIDPPAELPDPVPEPEPEPLVAPEPDAAPDHRAVHGADSIVDDERDYHIRRDGQRYVHVGEAADGRWVYRPD